MRVLITGGNGYVGREVVRQLLDEHDICVVDSVRYGQMRFTEKELEQLSFVQADVTDAAKMLQVVGQFEPDAVIHLAAIHYIPECEQNPTLAVSTNVVGTTSMLMACPPGCRFVFASSGAVYKPDAQPHVEATAIVEPNDAYGLSKLHGEHYVRYLAQLRGLSAVIVRLFNVVGPGETNPHLLPELVAQLKAGRTRLSLGNLFPKRDYIHVKDAAGGFVATALKPHVPARETITVNLGTSHPHSVAAVVRKLRRISGVQFEISQDQSRIRTSDRPVLIADTAQIASLFQWQATRSIDDALVDLWRNPDLSDNLTAKYQ